MKPDSGVRRASVATAVDVARRAGVSQSAVSRVFTKGASCSARTRKAVLEAAAELGYRPNLLARSLITRRSGLVAVAMGYLENQFYPAVLQALADQLGEAGYRILAFNATDGAADPVLEDVLRYHAEAVVLASARLSSALVEECRTAQVPIVLINRKTRSSAVSSVTGDNVKGGREIAAFLVAGLHQRFAYIAGIEDASTSRDRERGYFGYFADHNMAPPTRVAGNYSFEGAMVATRDLLSRKPRPDAIFCANDHMALAALQVARHEFKLQVPCDVSIVGFDDVEPARWPGLDLTTYSQPVKPMVEKAVRILLRLIEDPAASRINAVVPGELIVRQSARWPKTGIRPVGGREVWRSRWAQ